MDENAVELGKRSSTRFSNRAQLDTFRQEVALNFAPWLASWTTELDLGEDFAAHLTDGTPLLLARDFVGQIGAMLRPPGKQYFWHRTQDERLNNDREIREYLDWRSERLRRVLHYRTTGYVKACKEADEHFGLFGDAVLSVDYGGKALDELRIKCWHTKDCVWVLGDEGVADTLTRREMVPARIIKRRYGEKNLHQSIKDACEKNPDQAFEIRHDVLPADEYDAYRKNAGMKRKPGQWASVWTDVKNGRVLKESTWETMRYVVPGWVRGVGPYSISPATTIALPDARLIQEQALAILNAAEKSIEPPLIAYADTIRGAVRLDAGGITWVDKSYDEREGKPITPLELGKNFQLGVESLLRTEQQLTRAFYLDVLRMPDTRRTKATAEVQFLIDEYVRAALPLFAPIQQAYSDALHYEADKACEILGIYRDRKMPEGLSPDDLVFEWDNPLSQMIERQKAQIVSEISVVGQAMAAIEAAAAQSPSLRALDSVRTFRDTVTALGAAQWLIDEDDVKDAMEQQGQANLMQQGIAAAPSVAKLIDSGVNAAQAAGDIPNPAEPSFTAIPAPI